MMRRELLALMVFPIFLLCICRYVFCEEKGGEKLKVENVCGTSLEDARDKAFSEALLQLQPSIEVSGGSLSSSLLSDENNLFNLSLFIQSRANLLDWKILDIHKDRKQTCISVELDVSSKPVALEYFEHSPNIKPVFILKAPYGHMKAEILGVFRKASTAISMGKTELQIHLHLSNVKRHDKQVLSTDLSSHDSEGKEFFGDSFRIVCFDDCEDQFLKALETKIPIFIEKTLEEYKSRVRIVVNSHDESLVIKLLDELKNNRIAGSIDSLTWTESGYEFRAILVRPEYLVPAKWLIAQRLGMKVLTNKNTIFIY